MKLGLVALLVWPAWAISPVLVHTVGSENAQVDTNASGNTVMYVSNMEAVISGNCLGIAYKWSTAATQPSGFTPTDDMGDTFCQVSS